jgi:DNA-binding PadR family transcriptional regulator
MKGTNLGEFEELVLLTVLILQDNAYIIRIIEELKTQANRTTAMGALHATLTRLEKKGFLESSLAGGSEERGGRRKRVYKMTAAGKNVLQEVRNMRDNLWGQVPDYALKITHA